MEGKCNYPKLIRNKVKRERERERERETWTTCWSGGYWSGGGPRWSMEIHILLLVRSEGKKASCEVKRLSLRVYEGEKVEFKCLGFFRGGAGRLGW
jgi:hypothetical protein